MFSVINSPQGRWPAKLISEVTIVGTDLIGKLWFAELAVLTVNFTEGIYYTNPPFNVFINNSEHTTFRVHDLWLKESLFG